MNEDDLLARITVNPRIFGGKPVIRVRRLAVEHLLGMVAARDSVDTILERYPWLEREDIQACLLYARRRGRRPGSARGVLHVIEENEEHLSDFGEYMP